jgi:hypothetical protein
MAGKKKRQSSNINTKKNRMTEGIESMESVATNTNIMDPSIPYPPNSFSFACGGWLKMYLFGVAKALKEHELEKNARLIGCSAGALAASGLLLGCDFDNIRDYVIQTIVPKAHATLAGAFQARAYLMDTMLEHGNTYNYTSLNKKPEQLTVVYSSLSACTSRRVSSFESRDHFHQVIIASSCATPIAGLPFKLKGEWVMDGGLFEFQPILDEKTITVNPFYCTNADIRPSRYVPMWWALYPPSQRDVQWLFDLGYEDGLNWIARSGLVDPLTITIPTKGADYDGEWTTTVGRVIGYRGVESRVLDAMFVGLVVLLCKPLAFICLYLELYSRVIISASRATFYSAAAKFMISTMSMALLTLAFASINLEATMQFLVGMIASSFFLGMLVFLCGGIHEAASQASRDWTSCLSVLRSITSLSLFMRSVPVVGSSFRIKRHEYLLEHSLVYRLTFHFV